MDLLGNNKNQQQLSTILEDPFKKNKVVRLCINIYPKGVWGHNEPLDARGTIYFESGDTKGEQNFKENSTDALFLKIQAFLDTL